MNLHLLRKERETRLHGFSSGQNYFYENEVREGGRGVVVAAISTARQR
jgi:hypothetical protein